MRSGWSLARRIDHIFSQREDPLESIDFRGGDISFSTGERVDRAASVSSSESTNSAGHKFTGRKAHLVEMFQAVTRLSKAISAGVKLDEMNEVVAGVLDNTSHQLQQKNKLADKIAGVRIAITGVTSPAEISERKAIGAGMIVHTKDADHKYDETQDSVFAWVEKKFPLNPMPRNVKHLFKKITELAVEMKIDISKDEIAAALTEARKTESINAAEQVANIRGSLSQLAHSARVDEQEALNTKMRANRAALLASIREKMASKGPAANTIYRRPN